MAFVLRFWALLLALFVSNSLAFPTWHLAIYQYRCIAPNMVEFHSDAWGLDDWRISSICVPGTCCSNYAETGPLCTADACQKADMERNRLLDQHRQQEAAKKNLFEAQERQKANMQSTWTSPNHLGG